MNTPSLQEKTISTVSDEIDISQIFNTIWRGKWWIMLCTILAIILGGYYAFSVAEPRYTATANVVQETTQDPVIDFSGGLGAGLGADQSAINTEIEVLRSRALLEKLVDTLDLTTDPEFNPALGEDPAISIGKVIGFVWQMLGQPARQPRALTPEQTRDGVVNNVSSVLSVSNIRQSYVYRITATTNDPQKSARLVNKLGNLYILNQLDIKSESNLAATAWLTERLSQLRIDLENAEAAVKEFNAQTDLINVDTLAALNRQVKGLRDRLDTVRASQAALDARVAQLQAAGQLADPQTMAEIAQDRTLNTLFGNLGAGADQARTAFDARFNQLVTQDMLERDRIQTQIDALEASLIQQEQETDRQSTDLIALQQLEREAEANRLLYEYFLSRLKETSVLSGIQTPDSRILSRAIVPRAASAPRKSIILILSAILGVIAGSALVVIRELRQNTFRSAEDLEMATGLPVFGQIPNFPLRHRSKLLKYMIDKPTSIAVEAIRNMRTSILLSNGDNPPQIIMSTSSVPGEGKTTLSLSLAQNLSGLGKSVLLIEGDLRKRVFSEYFQLTHTAGLMAVLEGKTPLKEAVRFEKNLGADLLMSERPSSNAADIFSSLAFADFIKKVRADYDYIVIDTPPVLAVPDARIIGKHVDATMYSVHWDNTTKRQVAQGLKELLHVNVPVAGLVLGQIDQKGLKRYGYGAQAYAYMGYHNN